MEINQNEINAIKEKVIENAKHKYSVNSSITDMNQRIIDTVDIEGVSTDHAIYRAKGFLDDWKNDPSSVHSYLREKYVNLSEDEIFADYFFNALWRNICVAFHECNRSPNRFLYDVSSKKNFVSKMKEAFPCFDYSDMDSQIVMEEKGFLECVDTINAEGFNFMGEAGLFRVCFRRKPGKGVNIRVLSMHDFMDKKRNHSRFWLNTTIIKKAAKEYLPDYDFDSQKIEIVFLDYFGAQSKRKLEIAALIAIVLLHHNVQIDNNVIFTGNLTTNGTIAHSPFLTYGLLDGIDFERIVRFSKQKKRHSNCGTMPIHQYGDFQSFIDDWRCRPCTSFYI